VALTAVCAKINTLTYSIKHPETFQIAASLPIPQPSTLVGALAYCLGIQQGVGLNAQNIARKEIVIARASLVSEVTAINPIVLRRFRILDKGFQRKGKGEEEDFKKALTAYQKGDLNTFRRIIEETLTDALYREYLSPATLKCVWVLRSPIESKILYLLQRLGDTESLINVAEAWSAECKVERLDKASTSYYFTALQNVVNTIHGNYTAVRMCDEGYKLKLYYVPCKKDIRSASYGVKYFVYVPAKVDVELREPQEVYIINEEYIIGV
jgi:CRISPR-associated protein Cas5 subtype I-A